MHRKRIIPCLDIREGRVVKGFDFFGIRDASDPVELAVRYDAEADAVLAASIFHFGTYTIAEAKAHLAERGIPMRLTGAAP